MVTRRGVTFLIVIKTPCHPERSGGKRSVPAAKSKDPAGLAAMRTQQEISIGFFRIPAEIPGGAGAADGERGVL